MEGLLYAVAAVLGGAAVWGVAGGPAGHSRDHLHGSGPYLPAHGSL